MSQHPITRVYDHYRTPAVRHLAWMCQAPQLIDSPKTFDLKKYLPTNLEQLLSTWDRDPGEAPAALTEPPARRLGHYFERLYECLLVDLLGWEVLLKNQPIRNNGLTLGELDFIVRNPVDQAIEHHEIAVKFYLGYSRASDRKPLWYGPNARDRLDLKSERLISHQSQLTATPEARALLKSHDLPVPDKARIFMPGYLFYPADPSVTVGTAEEAGAGFQVPANHLRGKWLYIDDLDQPDRETASAVNPTSWIPLVKPHWLGPWQQTREPDAQVTEAALDTVRTQGVPRLFAAMKQSPEHGAWQEQYRVFVVPQDWPGT